MGRENKKNHIATLHREAILSAAEVLFLEKGVSSTTVEDISKKSAYSRRTIYAYYENKEDILYHIIFKSLTELKDTITDIVNQSEGFVEQYWKICYAMHRCHTNSPQMADSINKLKTETVDFSTVPQTVRNIFQIGTDINLLLSNFVEKGKQQGAVRPDIVPIQTVYILWSNIFSLFTLVQSKGDYLEREFQTSKSGFLEYGFKQIINSVLVESLPM